MPTSVNLNAEQNRKNVVSTKSVKVNKFSEQAKPLHASIRKDEQKRKSKVPSADQTEPNKTAAQKRTRCASTLYKSTGRETKTKLNLTKQMTATSSTPKRVASKKATTTVTTPKPSKVEARPKDDIAVLEQKLTPQQTEELRTTTDMPVASIAGQQQDFTKDQQTEIDLHDDLQTKELVKDDKALAISTDPKCDRLSSISGHTDLFQEREELNSTIETSSSKTSPAENRTFLVHACTDGSTADEPVCASQQRQPVPEDEFTNIKLALAVPNEMGFFNGYASSSNYLPDLRSVQDNSQRRMAELTVPCQQQQPLDAALYPVESTLQHPQQPVIVNSALQQDNSSRCDAQQKQQQQVQQSFRRRPLSYTEAMNNSYSKNCSYSCASPIDLASPPAEDYIAVHEPPFYCQSQPHHNNETHYAYPNHHQHQYNRQHHIRQQSDRYGTATRHYTSPSPPMSVISDVNNAHTNSNRKISTPTNNTMQNLLVYDGQTQRIVQLIGVDYNTAAAPLSSYQTHPLPGMTLNPNDTKYGLEAQQPALAESDWTGPATEVIDKQGRPDQKQQQLLFSALQQQDKFADSGKNLLQPAQQYHHHHRHHHHHQEHTASEDFSATECTGHSHHNNIRLSIQQLQRKTSNRSLNSLRSTSPSVQSCDSRYEQLNFIIEKERATVKALQKQKEAFNKDIAFLSKSLDEATTENNGLKKKLETNHVEKERYKEELTKALNKLNNAHEQIRHLENRNRASSNEIAGKTQELEILEKKYKQFAAARDKTVLDNTKQNSDRRLTVQLHQAQSQIKLLKSTMEQFLKMGVFSNDWNTLSPTTSIDALVSELRCGYSSRRQLSTLTSSKSRSSKSIKASSELSKVHSSNPSSNRPKADGNSAGTHKSVQSKLGDKSTDNNTHVADLHTKLQELAREKEILQAEYNKAPVSGGNKALVRRRREELEVHLDKVDTELRRVKLKLRNQNVA